MSKIRVWNITDDTNPAVKPHTRMVLGKVLKPGQSVMVDSERLKKAHKLLRDVEAGFLFIGNRPPASYTSVKQPPRATADARRVNSDGSFESKSPVAPGQGHGPLTVAAKDVVSPKPQEEPKSASVEAPKEEVQEASLSEETSQEEKSGSKKRRRK